VIRTLLEGGISLHVFGESWKEFPVPEGASGKLILHGHLRAEDAPDLYRRAKVSLNVMTWHKAGMTERVADSMLGGAVCVSDRTDYLEEHFTEEEICLYDLAHLEKLPGMIRTLLGRADDREIIRKKAEVKARKEHTWDARARQLQRLWNSDTRPGSMGIE
jgi:spore maturation protein CgeB